MSVYNREQKKMWDNALGYLKSGRCKQAIEAADRLINDNPSHAGAFDILLKCHLQDKNYKQAEQAGLNAIRLSPEYANSYSNLGHVYEKQGDIKKAKQMYEQAIKIDPQHASVAYISLIKINELLKVNNDKLVEGLIRTDTANLELYDSSGTQHLFDGYINLIVNNTAQSHHLNEL